MTDLATLSALISAMGNENQIGIIRQLIDVAERESGVLTVGEVADFSKLSQPLASHHIKQLAKGGLLIAEKKGTKTLVRLGIKHQNLTDSIKRLEHLGEWLNVWKNQTGNEKS